jgi:two-component system, LytTR family, sensor kinase
MSRLKTFVLAFLLWTALALFFATELYFAGLPWSQAVAWSLPRWYSWGLLTPAIFAVDRRLSTHSNFAIRLGAHLPLAPLFASASILLRLVTRPLRGSAIPADFSTFFFERFYADLPVYAVIAGVAVARHYAEQLGERARREQELALQKTELERRLVEASMQSLRAQLQPHFLFNALNTISALTESDPKTSRQLMSQLGDLLRASLALASRPLVTLGEEMTFLDDYLAIEAARFADRISVSVKMDEGLAGAVVPGFLLQPLVENAIKHGVGPRKSGGHVRVVARRHGHSVLLQVEDDGVGLPNGWSLERGAGVGLRNLAARLAQIYKRTDLLRVEPSAKGGVTVEVEIPSAGQGLS